MVIAEGIGLDMPDRLLLKVRRQRIRTILQLVRSTCVLNAGLRIVAGFEAKERF